MTFARPKRINGRVPVLTAEEAVKYIPDESTLCVLGAGGGILEATKLIEALAERYKTTQTPKNIGIISPTGLGDRAERGISPIAGRPRQVGALRPLGSVSAHLRTGRTK